MGERGRAARRELLTGVPAAAAAGAVLGVIGTFKHQVGVSAATGTGPPIGLVLALGMVALFLVALRLSTASRWFPAAAACGVVVAIGVLSLPGPGGSHVILLNYAGLVWSVAPVVIGVAVLVRPRRRSRAVSAPMGYSEPVAPSEDRPK